MVSQMATRPYKAYFVTGFHRQWRDQKFSMDGVYSRSRSAEIETLRGEMWGWIWGGCCAPSIETNINFSLSKWLIFVKFEWFN